MLQGFTDSHGAYHAPPATLWVTWPCVANDLPDPAHPDSTRHYRSVHVDSVQIVADVPAGADTLHEVGFGGQDFELVRGDAAVLDSTQRADSLRWYVRRWKDRAVPADAPPVHAPTVTITWGGPKAAYR